MTSSTKLLAGIAVAALAAAFIWQFTTAPTMGEQEFLVNAHTIPATPVDIPVGVVGNPIDVEIGVNDTIDEPDDTPWTLCGTIAGTPLNSSENDGFSYDVLGSLDPAEQDVEIRQDVNDDSIFFPQGGSTEDVHTFRCVAEGTNDLYFYFMTSRIVNSCDAESLRIMQDDPGTEKKTLALGKVRCIDPLNPPPPEEAGLERSVGVGDGIDENTSGNGVPEGFEYIGGQTIEVGTDGEFIDHGYLDRGNPPEDF